MKKFVLDFSTWRCGRNGNTGRSTGKGETFLLNSEGFSCCLGQVYLQKGVEPSELIEKYTPQSLYTLEHILKDTEGAKNDFLIIMDDNGYVTDSYFACRAININDDTGTSLEEKLFNLDKLFTSHNIEFSVINAPEHIMDKYLELKNNTK